jgi:hypothetical protein
MKRWHLQHAPPETSRPLGSCNGALVLSSTVVRPDSDMFDGFLVVAFALLVLCVVCYNTEAPQSGSEFTLLFFRNNMRRFLLKNINVADVL